MKILVCYDGSPASEMAVKWVPLFGFPAQSEITLLWVREPAFRKQGKGLSLDVPQSILSQHFISLKTRIEDGSAAAVILAEVGRQPYDLLVMGEKGGGRSIIHHRLGSTLSKVLKVVETPLLVTRTLPPELKRVLICTSGEPPAQQNIRQGARLLSFTKVDVSILHVMSQVALKILPEVPELLDTAQSAIQRGTREGIHLLQAVELVRQMGIKGQIQPILRHGLVLEQIKQELKVGQYDLLMIGSHHVPGQKQWLEIFLEDLASEILAEANCSVLVV